MKEINQENFQEKILNDELFRQFEIKLRVFESLQSKSQFFIGIIAVFFGFLLSSTEFNKIFFGNSSILDWISIIGIITMMISMLLFLCSLFITDLGFGKSLKTLVDKYNRNESIDKAIMTGIYSSIKRNVKTLNKKSVKIQWATWLFVISIMLLLGVKFTLFFQ